MHHCTANKYTPTNILFNLCCWYRLLYVCTSESEGARSVNTKFEAEFWNVMLYSLKICKYSVRTAQETLRLDYKIGQLMLRSEIIVVCYEIHKSRRNTLNCEQNVEFLW
jgi:hypothetical protein